MSPEGRPSVQGGASAIPGEALADGDATGPVWLMERDAVQGSPLDPEEARLRALSLLESLAVADEAQRQIIDAHRLMLDDPTLVRRVRELNRTLPALAAVRQAADEAARALEALDDGYLRARAQDVRDVGDLWSAQVEGMGAWPSPAAPSVVVAERVGVAWLLAQPDDRVCAIVVRNGAPTAHVAIVAGNLGIPMIAVADDEAFGACRRAARLRVNADAGVVELEPVAAGVAMVRSGEAGGPIQLGGRVLATFVNIGSLREAERAVERGADGVGLFRTELAFAAAGRLLREHEERALYEAVAGALAGRPITFRTLDVGADKPLPGLPRMDERNPQLGVRGVRLYRVAPAVFEQQARALADVGVRHVGVSIMLPMVATVEEWRDCHAVIDRAVGEAAARAGTGLRPRLGIMLEVPSALFHIAEFIAAGVSFFSLGTNDLLQYVYAVDRENGGVATPRVPVALLRLVAAALGPARAAAVPVAVCGQMGADPLLLPALVEAGVCELSVPLSKLAAVRRRLVGLARTDAWEEVVRAAMAAATSEEAERILSALA